MKFIKGNWYKNMYGGYIKFSNIDNHPGYNSVWFDEKIDSMGVHYFTTDYWANSQLEQFALKNPVDYEELSRIYPIINNPNYPIF